MIYGYLRVSSDEQDVNSQKQGVAKFAKERGWKIDEFITDQGVSGGKDPDKRNLGPLLKKLQKDDVVIAAEISRLGRDLYMVMDILHFCMKTGCKIYTVKDNFSLDDNVQSKVLAFAFGLAAEIERQMIRQRTREGLRLRMKLGVLLGRPIGKQTDENVMKLTPHKNDIIKALEWGASIRSIAAKLGVDRNTVARNLMRWNITCDEASFKDFVKKEQKYREENRKCSYKDEPYCIVELPREQVLEYIMKDMTIPQIHESLPSFTYEQVYDTILCDSEFNILYRQHGQLKVKKGKH